MEGITLYKLLFEMGLPEPSKKELNAIGLRIGRVFKDISPEPPPIVWQKENTGNYKVNKYPLEFRPIMENIINDFYKEKNKSA